MQVYEAALSTAIALGKTGDVVGGVHVCFAEGIKLCTKQVRVEWNRVEWRWKWKWSGGGVEMEWR